MTRDYMNRPLELMILDAVLTVKIENISNLLDEDLHMPMVLALGPANASTIAKTNSIAAAAEKRSAIYIASRAEDLDLISYDDWYRIHEMIVNMDVGDPEDFKSWN